MYSHLGAISIMVRGGFKNLMEAYLSAQPPIEEFMEVALGKLQSIGHSRVYCLLKNYQ
jgi:hypothetical protein